MYLRAAHAELHIPSLRRFIYENPLGILITSIKSPNFATIQCTHLPWILDVQDETSVSELGIIRGHLAKANPHAKCLTEAVQALCNSNGRLTDEVSVIFNGPAHHYVTPKFYTDTKPNTGKVVPTWNYSAVQVYGKATIFWDSKSEQTSEFLQSQINDLSWHTEKAIMGHDKPWEVADAPVKYIDIMKSGIMGIEIEITRLEGKYKMSQELNQADRQGVVDGFRAMETDTALKVADTVETRGNLKR